MSKNLFVILKCFLFLIALRFLLYLEDGVLTTYHARQTGWTHVVLNYIGPNNGEGIRMFIDGTEVASSTTKHGRSYSPGDGRIVVGRYYTNYDGNYASVQMDELIYFNAAMTSTEVQLIYNSA